MKNTTLKYPSGAEFAFTILDDTDDTTVANGRPVYDLLRESGLRTTKTVWAFSTPHENRGPYFAGETLSSPEYLKWVHELSNDGFEIAFHNATMGSSIRQETIRALDLIEREFGQAVRLHCNHGQNRENLYWGIERYSSCILKECFHILGKFSSYPIFEGNKPESPYYWADIAAERLSYIRLFAFRHLNGMQIPPARPFQDAAKQLNPLFFNTSDAPNIKCFNKLVNRASIDKLRKDKGWAIISTHLGKGFYRNNKLNPEFEKSIEYLRSLPGWYVPASQLLDFIKAEKGVGTLSTVERSHMEYAHIVDRISDRIFSSKLLPPVSK